MTSEERILELEKVLNSLLEAVRYCNDGCGCCGAQSCFHMQEYKTAEEVLQYDWRKRG